MKKEKELNKSESDGKNKIGMGKKIDRRTFCACMAAAGVVVAGQGLASCSKDEGSGSYDGGLTEEQVNQLKAKGFLNVGDRDNGAIVVDNGGNPKAFTRYCPHEGGLVTAESRTAFRCGKHTKQVFNFDGNDAPGNGVETPDKLREFSVTDNGDGTYKIVS